MLWVASESEATKISAMDLTVTRQQYDAVRNAKHLPTCSRTARQGEQTAAATCMHLTYEEATALERAVVWNVHTESGQRDTGVAGVRRASARDLDSSGI